MGLLTKLREAVATSELPQLQRAGDPLTESFSAEDRKRLAGTGAALGDGSFPIETKDHLKSAIGLVGNAKDPGKAKAHVIKRAKALGATSMLPDSWKIKEAGSTKQCPTCDGKGKILAGNRDCPDCDGTGAVPGTKPAVKSTEALHILTREALVKTGKQYEATIVREGPGNPEDRNYYTREALQKAVHAGLFEGLQAYANHPTATEERERPERDVRQLVGHFREARYVEQDGVGKVKARFVPVHGQGYEWVTSLIESALNGVPGRPLIGISIDGQGEAPDQQTIDGRSYNLVREVISLSSADLVTRAGAGGEFIRQLQESWRQIAPAERLGASKEEVMKAVKLQEKIKSAAQTLDEAAGLTDGDEHGDKLVKQALKELHEAASATIEPEVEIREVEKIVEKLIPASEDEKDKIAVKLQEARTKLSEEQAARREAEAKVEAYEQAKLAARIIRDSEVPDTSSRVWFDEMVKLEDEAAMTRFVESKKAERQAILAELRESFTAVEGNPARQPTPTPPGRSLAGALGIDPDELKTAAA